MKVFATGKWNKEDKRWSMVVAIRRPGREASAASRKGQDTKSKPQR